MSDPTKELIFQNEVIAEMVAGGWKRGNHENYDRGLALYPGDVGGFVKGTQLEQREKFCSLDPSASAQKFLERVGEQLNQADPLAANQTMRAFGTLGGLRHEQRDRGTRFFLCPFKLEHGLNPDNPRPLRQKPPARRAGGGLQRVGDRGRTHHHGREGQVVAN